MKKYILLIALAVSVLTAKAQFNVDRLITSGKVALHYEDYVLSIQYFNQVIALNLFCMSHGSIELWQNSISTILLVPRRMPQRL